MGLSLGQDVEAFSPKDYLEPGPYIAAPVTPVTRKNSNAGDPQIELDWRVAVGNFRGSEARDWITFMESTLGNVAMVLDACKIDRPAEEFESYEQMRDWVADQLDKAPRATIVMRPDPKPYVDKKTGETKTSDRPKIVGYRQVTSSDLDNGAATFGGAPCVANGAGETPPPF
jgi:hypothetical protein